MYHGKIVSTIVNAFLLNLAHYFHIMFVIPTRSYIANIIIFIITVVVITVFVYSVDLIRLMHISHIMYLILCKRSHHVILQEGCLFISISHTRKNYIAMKCL